MDSKKLKDFTGIVAIQIKANGYILPPVVEKMLDYIRQLEKQIDDKTLNSIEENKKNVWDLYRESLNPG